MSESGHRLDKWSERREDYALRYVPESYRNWSWLALFGVVGGV